MFQPIRPQITTTQWLELPTEIRWKLTKLFSIPRSKGTEVVGNRVVSDGYTHADLAHISTEKMQSFLGTDEKDFFTLLNKTMERVFASQKEEMTRLIEEGEKRVEAAFQERQGALNELKEKIESLITQESDAPKKRGRPKKVKS